MDSRSRKMINRGNIVNCLAYLAARSSFIRLSIMIIRENNGFHYQ